MVRPGSKYLIWQRSYKSISYKAKFSQRENIFLVDLKHNITYQNIRGKLRSELFYDIMLKMAKNLPYNLHGGAFYKTVKFVLTKRGYE